MPDGGEARISTFSSLSVCDTSSLINSLEFHCKCVPVVTRPSGKIE